MERALGAWQTTLNMGHNDVHQLNELRDSLEEDRQIAYQVAEAVGVQIVAERLCNIIYCNQSSPEKKDSAVQVLNQFVQKVESFAPVLFATTNVVAIFVHLLLYSPNMNNLQQYNVLRVLTALSSRIQAFGSALMQTNQRLAAEILTRVCSRDEDIKRESIVLVSLLINQNEEQFRAHITHLFESENVISKTNAAHIIGQLAGEEDTPMAIVFGNMPNLPRYLAETVLTRDNFAISNAMWAIAIIVQKIRNFGNRLLSENAANIIESFVEAISSADDSVQSCSAFAFAALVRHISRDHAAVISENESLIDVLITNFELCDEIFRSNVCCSIVWLVKKVANFGEHLLVSQPKLIPCFISSLRGERSTLRGNAAWALAVMLEDHEDFHQIIMEADSELAPVLIDILTNQVDDENAKCDAAMAIGMLELRASSPLFDCTVLSENVPITVISTIRSSKNAIALCSALYGLDMLCRARPEFAQRVMEVDSQVPEHLKRLQNHEDILVSEAAKEAEDSLLSKLEEVAAAEPPHH